jgi:hypothetical protein
MLERVDIVIPTMYEYHLPYQEFLLSNKYSLYLADPVFAPLDIGSFNYRCNTVDKKIKFWHGLNREGAKGTNFIRPAFERLNCKYSKYAEFIIPERVPYNEFIEFVNGYGNISLEQVFLSSPGYSGICAMATGQILCGADPTVIKNTFKLNYDLPTFKLQPNIDQIQETCEFFLDKSDLLEDWGSISRQFAEEFDYSKSALQFVELWQQVSKGKSI